MKNVISCHHTKSPTDLEAHLLQLTKECKEIADQIHERILQGNSTARAARTYWDIAKSHIEMAHNIISKVRRGM